MIGDEGPYLNESGDIWVPRTIPYLEARKVARDGMSDYEDRLVYVGKEDAALLGFTRDCRCDETCVLAILCATCGHDHGDYEGQCWGVDCACPVYDAGNEPCNAPAWHFRSEEPA